MSQALLRSPHPKTLNSLLISPSESKIQLELAFLPRGRDASGEKHNYYNYCHPKSPPNISMRPFKISHPLSCLLSHVNPQHLRSPESCNLPSFSPPHSRQLTEQQDPLLSLRSSVSSGILCVLTTQQPPSAQTFHVNYLMKK